MKEQSDSKKLIPLYLKEIFLQKTDKTHFIRMPEIEYYVTAEPPVRRGESHLSGQTEPPCY